MYTRSFSTRQGPTHRPLPPDYGGTALTIPRSEESALPEGAARPAVTPPPPSDSYGRRSRRPLSSRQEFSPSPRPEAPPPFGGVGQPPRRKVPPKEKGGLSLPETTSTSESGFRLLHLQSDDLLLLGLAMLLLNDKDRPEGSSNDALLLLAMLYVSGL